MTVRLRERIRVTACLLRSRAPTTWVGMYNVSVLIPLIYVSFA